MAKTSVLKQERIEIRVNREVKEFIQRAADAMGTSLTAFTTQQLYDAAKRTLIDLEVLVLTNKERDQFLSLLADPPQPNTALRVLLKKPPKVSKK